MKTALRAVAGLLLLLGFVFGGAVLYWLNSDASMWKTKLAELASTQMGRTLSISGTIEPTFSIAQGFGIKVTGVALANAAGFQPASMLQLDELELVVDVLAALRQEVHIKKFVLRGADVTLEARGQSNNWTFKPAETTAPQSAAGEGDTAKGGLKLAADQVLVERLALTHINNGTRKNYSVATFSLQAAAGEPVQMQLAAAADGVPLALALTAGTLDALQSGQKQPLQVTLDYGVHKLALVGQYRRNGSEHALSELALDYNGIKASGMLSLNMPTAAGAVPNVIVDLNMPVLDLAQLPQGNAAATPAANTAAGTAAAGKQPLFSREPLPWDLLKSANLNLVLDVQQLRQAATVYGPLNLQAKLQNGALAATAVAQPPSAQSPITARITANSAQNLGLTVVAPALDPATLATWLGQEAPLVQAPAKMNLQLTGNGASLHQVMSSANGGLQFAFAPGKLNADALPATVTTVLGSLLGGDALQNASVGCMQGDFAIQNGVANVRALGAAATVLNASGTGNINLRDETLALNMVLDARDTIKQAPLLPVGISGSLQNPSVTADAKALAGQVVNSIVDNVAAQTIVGKFGGLAKAVTGMQGQAVQKPFNPCRPDEKPAATPAASAPAGPAAAPAKPDPAATAQELINNPAAAKEMLKDPSKLLNLFGQ